LMGGKRGEGGGKQRPKRHTTNMEFIFRQTLSSRLRERTLTMALLAFMSRWHDRKRSCSSE
jgi:hypothetical protein